MSASICNTCNSTCLIDIQRNADRVPSSVGTKQIYGLVAAVERNAKRYEIQIGSDPEAISRACCFKGGSQEEVLAFSLKPFSHTPL